MYKMFKEVGLLTQHEIEVRMAMPLIKAFMEEVGKERALAVVRRVIEQIGLEQGAQLAEMAGGDTIEDFGNTMGIFSADGAQEEEVLEFSDTMFSADTTYCRYAEICKEMGETELGYELLCARDPFLFKGFNPKFKLARTKTIMQGDDICDFRVTLK